MTTSFVQIKSWYVAELFITLAYQSRDTRHEFVQKVR